jgi:DNA primase
VPGIDFNRLRAEITIQQVLHLLHFQPSRRAGAQWSGQCPLHDPTSGRSQPFSVNVALGRYYCHQCRSHGNQLELWSAANKLSLHQAAIDLCRALDRDVPWILTR